MKARCQRCITLLLFLISANTVIAQQPSFKQGVKQGVVKVKFAKAMSMSLSSMRISSDDEKLLTGIKSFDAVSEKHSARRMKRLIPKHPNPVIEAKHEKHGLHLWYVVEVDENQDPVEVANAYMQLGEVQVAEVENEKVLSPTNVVEYKSGINTMATEEMPFNDPYLIDQWHYNNTEQFEGAIDGSDINLFEAWTATAGSSDVIVSIHDTGVDADHNDLAANMWINEAEKNGTSGVDDDNNGFVDDIHGWNFNNNSAAIEVHYHATHVAGTIAAVNNNGIGVAGVAGGTGNNDGARIMTIDIIGGASANNIESGFVYAADNGAVISQNSWGYTSPGAIEQSILDGIDYFIAEAGDYSGSPMKGGIVIFAAGNSGMDADFYPGYYDNVLTVASIGADFTKAEYSNYGEWVDITAPGGNASLNIKGGILSTLPDNQVGYLDGTSMACPHVSGVAALILANRDHQYTPDELRNQLVTGVVDIDQYNPGYVGKMGSGLTDVVLALAHNENFAPNAITDLTLTSISQEFAIIDWSVPSDTDDGQPTKFHIYYSTDPLDASNLGVANHVEIDNKKAPGETESIEVSDLFGLTTYYFTVISADRWGNNSALSNSLTGTTNAGPSIDVDDPSKAITLDIDIASDPTDQHEITILNNDEGLLRWEFASRQTSSPSISSFAHLAYPKLKKVKPTNVEPNIGMGPSVYGLPMASEGHFQTMSFETVYKDYGSWAGAIVVGETDTTLTNSSATQYFVDEPGGFNLTDVDMIVNHDPTTGPMIIEVYRGSSLDAQNLIHAQEHTAASIGASLTEIHLDEQLYFEEGETFWIVFHVPSGNLFPLGMGIEFQSEYSDYCYMSLDLGDSWLTLESAIGNSSYAWTTAAISKNEYLGEFLTLTPSSGEIVGNSQAQVTLSANGSELINGTYEANAIFRSNDPINKELRLPVTINVLGHQPQIYSESVIDFGTVFNGTSKQLSVLIENYGYGHWNGLTITSSNPDYTLVNTPTDVFARDSYNLTIEYAPTTVGSASGTITLSAGGVTHIVSVYANSIVPPQITISPLQQTISPINLSDSVTAVITVENTGDFPLSYYVPGWGDPGVVGETSGTVHQYGYRVLTNEDGATIPATYVWNDISSTGISVSQYFKDMDFSGPGSEFHYTVPLEFRMPFYSDVFDTVYITNQGMIDFENERRLVNTPRLGFQYGPFGFISAFGEEIEFGLGGDVFYYSDQNRFIVQYDNVIGKWLSEWPPISFQIEMLDNGDINIYYKDIENFVNFYEVGWSIFKPIIENAQREDGIQLNGYNNITGELHQMQLINELAVTFEYPGPDIIYAMSNASGSILSGESRDITVSMATASLYEGLIKRNINVISNDPFNGSAIAATILDITSGGTADIEVPTTEIQFGQVFQGAQVSEEFFVKNNGTAPTTVDLTLSDGNFTLSGNTSVSIAPSKLEKYIVELPTTTVGILKDTVNIVDGDGNNFEIILLGEVLDPPAVNVDLSQISLILQHGDQYEYPFTIESTGIADLEVAVTGTDWLSVEMDGVTPTHNTYSWKSSVDDTTGFEFGWRDIINTGTRVPDTLNFEPGTSWAPLELPFTFNFYGQPYNTIYMGYNGILSFSDNQTSAMFAELLPPVDHGYEDGPDNFLAPLWLSGGFDIITFGDLSGLYYEAHDDHVIITYSYINSVFGMGQMISHQTILYPNGTIIFQYRIEDDQGWGELTTQWGSVGVVNEGSTDFVQISGLSNIGIGEGLAYALTPTESYVASPGTTLNGIMTFDASTVYAGVYPTSLVYNTNVPGSEVLKRPVTLRVIGDPELTLSTDIIDYGDVYAYEKNGEPVAFQKEFSLRNDGVATLTFGSMTLENANTHFKMEVYYKDTWGVTKWRDASEIGSMNPLKPNTEVPARITLTPTVDGTINNNIIITSQVADATINLIGNAFFPPVISAPEEEVSVMMDLKTDTDTRTVTIENTGASDLTYEFSIEFNRAVSSTSTHEETLSLINGISTGLGTVEANGGIITTHGVEEDFNRVLSYESASTADNFLGFGGSGQLTAATKFNAGEDGFNITHAQTFFRPEDALEGLITVEVRAGGTDVTNAVSLTSFDYQYSYASEDQTGSWVTIPLEVSQIIAPNEDFYLVFTYPMNIDYPQGIISGVEDVERRYTFEYQETWYDLQVDFESGSAYMIRAAEETYASGEWVTINGTTKDIITAAGQTDVTLDFAAANAQQGWQYANLVISSNDPLRPEKKVPLALHLNEGPVFTNVPNGIQFVDEADTLTLVVNINDPEGHSISVESAEEYIGIIHSLSGNELTIIVTPGYEDQGIHNYSFVAKDEFGAEGMLDIQVEVINTNRAPEPVPSNGFTYVENGDYEQYYFTDFFTDPEGDSLSFSIRSSDELIVEVYTAQEQFMVVPKEIGDTTIVLYATDIYGATTSLDILVSVEEKIEEEVILGIENEIASKISVYPNPTSGNIQLQWGDKWTGHVTLDITSITGAYVKSYEYSQITQGSIIELDLSHLDNGIYVFKITNENHTALLKILKE